MTRDRNESYQPDGLYLDGRPQYTEISPIRAPNRETLMWQIEQARTLIDTVGGDGGWTSQPLEWVQAAQRWREGYRHLTEATRSPKFGRIAHGQADELNRGHHGDWWWADVSGDESHWSHFRGHRIQVDVWLQTWNEREVNSWKGRDEIRPAGRWKLSLNRQPIHDGYLGDDPLAALRRIEEIARKLMDHPAINWFSDQPVPAQLTGRKVYYDRTPAVITYTSTLDQGCVGLKPVGVDRFPPAIYDIDSGDDIDMSERDEIKVELLDPHIWWWRSMLIEGVETPAVQPETAR